MSNCCDKSNPLIRDGVSQRQRQALALSPNSVQVDEQDLADFLVFAYRLSQQIIHYKANGQPGDNEPDGNWQSFFTNSAAVQLALISKTRPQIIRDTYGRQLEIFLSDRTPKNLAPVLLTLSGILDRIRSWFINLPAYSPFRSIIRGLVKSNLRDPLLRLQAFEQSYQMATGQSLTRPTYQDFNAAFDLPDVISAPDHTPLQGTGFEARTELDQVFQVLFQNYRQVIQQAPSYLADSLESRQDHPPHLALYLAFWEVLKPARDDLNRMTQRHLDFFHREVLQFPEKPVQPDRANLIFELAKFQQEYKLNSGTAFKAGKDASGVELIYKLNEDIVIHKAQIASLKGLFLALQETGTGKPIHLRGIHTSTIANSADGQGAEFPKDQLVKAWKPFGDSTRPHAVIGLAIASDIFYLQESSRTIIFTLTFDQAPVGVNLSDLHTLFTVDFSGKKDWVVGSILASNNTSPVSSTVQLTVTLTADQDPVGAYHAGLAGAALSTDKPVARIRLNDQAKVNGRSPYSYLRDIKLKVVSVRTTVSEVRNLVLQNDQSVFDDTKPFAPFSSLPKMGMTLYIGSKEVFQKHLIELTLNVHLEIPPPQNWATYYEAYGVAANFSPGQLSVQALRDKQWQPEPGLNRSLFNLSASPFTASDLSLLKLNCFVDIEPFEKWDHQTKNGFIRLELVGQDFLHDQYPTVLARQVLAAATSEIITSAAALPKGVSRPQRKAVIGAYYQTDTGIKPADTYYISPSAKPLIPNQPFTPVIQALYLSYVAESQYTLSTSNTTQPQDIQLFHLYPFDGFSAIAPSSPVPFLPTFVDEGTLYIGIQDLNPPTVLPLLIQVAEETANTDLRKASVQWAYLANNNWQNLEQYQVISDGTNGLIASGIVQLAIPAAITKGNTLLNADLYWIKISVAKRSGAVCNIIGVHTQAAQATFSDQSNDLTHLVEPLPAGTIAKLFEPQPAIKTIIQPYNSFDGRGKEASTQYYIRVSEHLRHKGRAVTIFDYERLVLEQFPEIYKVRCINHSRINDDIPLQTRDNLQELVPGSITLAVIPDLSHRNTTNDLEPKVNINLLDDIRKYLVKLGSPWVDIRVVNPHYEAIQVEFQVQFKSPYDGNFGYYQRELQRAIIGFLSPWTVNSGADIHFGGKVYRSSILNFVEEQPYVDYVLNFQMHRDRQRNLQDVVASSARSILVSVPFPDNTSDPSGSSTGHLIHQASGCPVNRPISANVLGYDRLDQLMLE
ncbi:hypothetical protein H6F89_34210 [Cyanobacteria bacterium FACHB-63]|nr:hypothetical protein [Cyanobacteria bacterium FACHB-63]